MNTRQADYWTTTGRQRESGGLTTRVWGVARLLRATLVGLALVGSLITATLIYSAQPPTAGPQQSPGAIFTTTADGTATNANTVYLTKDDVYLNGGPTHPGAAGMDDGFYYVQVTAPSGIPVLGVSPGAAVQVTNGEFAQLYQLSAIVNTASSGFTLPGYDDTTNPGGEYKVWVSKTADFFPDLSKTDNFKVRDGGGGPGGDDTAILQIVKFYDTNANGVQDDVVAEPAITGWLFHVSDDIHLDRWTPITLILAAPGTYTIYEMSPLEPAWIHTTPDVVQLSLGVGTQDTEMFGNVCLGQRGGLTLGFWSNKNGQKATTTADLVYLSGLNLRNGNGTMFDPTTTAQLSRWLLNANAVNMANMLSAQLAAMELNVRHTAVSGVAGDYILYRPELNQFGITYNSGFITVNTLMAEANAALADPNGYTITAGPVRTYQEALKNALDDANNNRAIYVLPPSPLSTFTF